MGHTIADARRLPLNLPDGVRTLEQSGAGLRHVLGAELVRSFCKLKHAEWNDHCRQLSQWERDTTLNC